MTLWTAATAIVTEGIWLLPSVSAWADGLFVVFECAHFSFGAHGGAWMRDVSLGGLYNFEKLLCFSDDCCLPNPPPFHSPPEFLPSFNPLCLNPVFPHPMSSAYFCVHPWSLSIRLFLITSPQLFPSRPSLSRLSRSHSVFLIISPSACLESLLWFSPIWWLNFLLPRSPDWMS